MPIYRKLVREVSKAVIAVKADTKEEANKLLEDFLSNSDERYYSKHDEYRDFMNSQCNEDVIDLLTFENEDDYNRYASTEADFWLGDEPKKDEEPKYDLYFVIDEDNVRNVWHDITLSEVIIHINSYNKIYILNPNTAYISFSCYEDAKKRGTNVVAYKLTKRKEPNNG